MSKVINLQNLLKKKQPIINLKCYFIKEKPGLKLVFIIFDEQIYIIIINLVQQSQYKGI